MSRTWAHRPYRVLVEKGVFKKWIKTCTCDWCVKGKSKRKEMKGKLLEQDFKEELG